MKQGRSLQDLAREVQRQADSKADFLVPMPDLTLMAASDLGFAVGSKGYGYAVSDYSHGQLAEELKIPKAFYDRLRTEDPDAVDFTVNRMLQRSTGKIRLIRTLDGRLRAFLSNGYRRFDHLDLVERMLPPILNFAGEVRVESCEITERRLYLKFIIPSLEREIRTAKRGEVIQVGTIISNSEIGAGRIQIAPFSKVLSCLNGATHDEFGKARAHLGSRVEVDEAEQFYTDATKAADDEAFWRKMVDIAKACLTENMLNAIADRMQAATGVRIEGDPVHAVELVGAKYQLNEAQRTSVLNSLIEGGDLSLWGMHQAITAAAGEQADYDTASAMERIGGQILTLPKSEYREVALAA